MVLTRAKRQSLSLSLFPRKYVNPFPGKVNAIVNRNFNIEIYGAQTNVSQREINAYTGGRPK